MPFARLTFASALPTLDTVVRLYLCMVCLQKVFFNIVKIYFCPLEKLNKYWEMGRLEGCWHGDALLLCS